MSKNYDMHATTILIVKYKDEVAIAADSQATIGGSYIAKNNVNKLRHFNKKSIYMGFAGTAKDGITLYEILERKLKQYNYNLKRTCVEISNEFRKPGAFIQEASVIIADKKHIFQVTGSGEISEYDNVCSIGSGSIYASIYSEALIENETSINDSKISAATIVKKAMLKAAEKCTGTNDNIKIANIENPPSIPKTKKTLMTKIILPKVVEIKKIATQKSKTQEIQQDTNGE